MLRHVALFRFVPEATDEQRRAALDGRRSLPAQIPELLDHRVDPALTPTRRDSANCQR